MSEAPSIDGRNFAVFHLPEGSTLRDAAEKLSRMDPDKFRMPNAFAFIFSSEIEGEDADVSAITSYDSSRSHYIVDRNGGRIRIRNIENGRLDLSEMPSLRTAICQADLLNLMMSDGSACVLEPGGNYHFVTPALMHSERFIRIGDLVRNRPGLDRLVFWLDEAMSGINGLLVDTWSISSISLRALQLAKLDVPFDSLPEHPTQNPEGCRAVIQNLVNQMGGVGKILVLVSISGSGSLVEKLKASFEEVEGKVEVQILSLYGFTSTPASIACLARIDDKGNSYASDECELCRDDSITIPIDPSSYHIRSWREHLVITGERHFKGAKSFIENYKGQKGVFSVHRNDPSDNRHHAFDIDVGRLLELPSFLKATNERLDKFSGLIDLVICPSHQVALRIKDIAVAATNANFVAHDTLERSSINDEDALLILNAKKILIVDDTVNSGSRIHRYIQSLREGQYGDFETIDVFAGVVRPETEAELQRISRSISDRHPWSGKLYFAEKIILPRWGSDKCPWCKEFDRLSKLAEAYALPPNWLTDRLQQLRNTTDGLSERPLFMLPGLNEPNLGDGSPICGGGATPVVVLFAVASGLQQHRSEDDLQKQLHPDFPLSNVLDPQLFSRYDEGLIRAAFLRNITRHELGSTAAADSWSRLTKEIRKENQKVVAGELIASLGRRTFPLISSAQFCTIFDSLLPEADLQKLSVALGLP